MKEFFLGAGRGALIFCLAFGAMWIGALTMRSVVRSQWERCVVHCDAYNMLPSQVGADFCQCRSEHGITIELRFPKPQTDEP